MSKALDAVPNMEDKLINYRPLLEWMSCSDPSERPTARTASPGQVRGSDLGNVSQ